MTTRVKTRRRVSSFAEIRRSQMETERIIKDTRAEIQTLQARTAALQAETAAQMKETDRAFGRLTNRFGEMIEHLVAPNIVSKFNELGYEFEGVSRDIEIRLDNGRALAEFDFLMENRHFVVGIEVKAKMDERRVAQLIEKLMVLRRYKDQHGDTRKIRGAVASPIMGESVRREAFRAGLYVIEQSGDTVRITAPPGGALREW